ncbi:MAG TPA: membrane protein insertase YidC [Burkholderiaceae bacterium]|nr:membrane protein insertase YidC [Burkholderiaceae bacterium]
MDTRRTVLWVIFSLSLLLLWDAWLKHTGRPSMFAPPPVTSPAAPSSSAAPPSPNAGLPNATTPSAGTTTTPPTTATTPIANVPHEKVQITTDLVVARIDTLGAELSYLELLRHKSNNEGGQNVVLLADKPGERIYLAQSGLVGGTYPNHRTPFTRVPGPTELAAGQDRLEVAFEAEAGNVKLRKVYSFMRGSYEIGVRHELVNAGTTPVSPSLYLQILRDGTPPQGESKFYSTFTGPAAFTEEAKFHKIPFSDIDKGKAKLPPPARDGWIGLIQHYFVTAWIPPQGVQREFQVRKLSAGDPYPVDTYTIATVQPVGLIAPGASTTIETRLFSGPQDQQALEKIAPGLDLVVDYGWLTFIAKPLFWLLQFFHKLLGNWGWAIVLLTIVVKGAFYPLSAASYKSMAKMRAVTPRMMKIREQYKDDRQKMNMAMMELYRTEKINPLGGCLPIVVQIPVFIALYWVLLAAVEMRGAPWIGWIHDLTAPDKFFILPAIMIVTMWVQYKLNPTPPDPVQAKVFMVMPLVFGATMIFFPSGLVLYWVVNNMLSIAQQWQITRMIEGKPVFARAKS